MGEFRIGRKFAKHVYPDNSRAAALLLFARNFATGPKTNTAVDDDGAQIPWNLIDSEPSFAFTIAANGVTMSVAGDVTGSFSSGDTLNIYPTTPAVTPAVQRSINTVPAFAAGFTTWDISSAIDATTTGGTIQNATTTSFDVPITPRVTGVVRISGVVGVRNSSGSPIALVGVNVEVDGEIVVVPTAESFGPLANGDTVAIPFLAEVTLPIGTTSNIEVLVTGEGAIILTDASVIDVQEVSVATG